MVSESSEGRALPQNVNGRYDASEERHLARLVTKASLQFIIILSPSDVRNPTQATFFAILPTEADIKKDILPVHTAPEGEVNHI